ncbi:MAG: hypothetical protein ACJAYU_001234 [Bradymonadia bacterium]|jgi:hypothetical protein
MPRRIIFIVLLVVPVLLGLAIPIIQFRNAEGVMSGYPCGSELTPRAPSSQFFAAIERLDQLSAIPWTPRAAQIAEDAANECLEIFTGRCSVLRDEAVDAARIVLEARFTGAEGAELAGEQATVWQSHLDEDGVRSLCNGWVDWRRWLAEEGLDAAGACALCAEL